MNSDRNASRQDSAAKRGTDPGFRLALRLLWWEAGFAIAYETCVGPGILSALAGEQGVGLGLVAWLNALPWLGQTGQLAGWFVLRRAGNLKRYTVAVAAFSRALWAIPLLAGLWAVGSGSPFPSQNWFLLAAAVAACAAPLASSSAVAWFSWMRSLVPGHLHGRFLGIRQRHVMVATLAANAFVLGIVSWKGTDGARFGFLAVLAAGVFSGALSTWLLAQVPAHRSLARNPGPGPAPAPLSTPFRDREFVRVLTFGACFHGAVHFSAPYFPYYFTHDLGFSTGTFAFWTALASLGNAVAAGVWGRRTDRPGGALATLSLCVIVIALSPFPYAVAPREWVAWLSPPEYFLNGAAWAGYVVAYTSLLFSRVPKGASPTYFSVYSATLGIMGAAGTLLGSWVAGLLEPHGGLRALWWAGGGLRVLVAGVGIVFLYRGLNGIRAFLPHVWLIKLAQRVQFHRR
ncbi:MAG: MFS transporter [Bdellovibrionales bacterium]|nr:MFS transporter [Bdellovibrionales bacterium]